METKKCKKCQEEINKKAKKCPKCGARQGMPIWLIVIIAIFVIGIIGNMSKESDSSSSKSTNNKTNTQEEIIYTKIDIDELESALESNAAAAKDTYKGKYLEITGRLGTIDSDMKYIGLLSTTNEWDIVGVHCTIKNSATKDIVKTLSKDQTIIVKGKITDVGEVLGYYLDIDEIIPQ